MAIADSLHNIQQGLLHLLPEIVLTSGLIVLVIISFFKKGSGNFSFYFSIITAVVVIFLSQGTVSPMVLFNGTLQVDGFSSVLKILMNAAVVLTSLMCLSRNDMQSKPEFCALIMTVVLGGHFLVMSNNLLMLFLSLETISIASYVLAGLHQHKTASEASLKYFLFGSAVSALMLYGFTLFYGFTGTLDFTSQTFLKQLLNVDGNALILAGLMALGGFLFKIAAAPMHLWAPDVYEGAPMPVIAFFSVAPKLAGFGVLVKFVYSVNMVSGAVFDWQTILAVIAILTIAIGNFAALAQRNVKRLMAYSAIAQSGFLLVGVVAFLPQGIQFMLFYAAVYTVMNFLVFAYLQDFELRGFANVADYNGSGKRAPLALILLLVGLISLTGLPPTAGFTGKLFLFTGLWESYQFTGKSILLWLLIFGLVNTVVSLFYYLKIPYYAFLKQGESSEKQNFLRWENLLGLILVVVILALFFQPGLLMGWINKANFVL